MHCLRIPNKDNDFDIFPGTDLCPCTVLQPGRVFYFFVIGSCTTITVITDGAYADNFVVTNTDMLSDFPEPFPE